MKNDFINDKIKTNNLIPNYIYRSLFLNKNKVNEDKATLIQIWKDFDYLIILLIITNQIFGELHTYVKKLNLITKEKFSKFQKT